MASANGYNAGDVVESHFAIGFVAASYLASLCGCVLTIELLHRRGTALGNWRSWFETLGCATSMGLVGIWCMHFIGNRAIVLANGDWTMQLVYNSGYTTLSVFLPIIGLTISFSAAEYPTQSKALHWFALSCTGVFAGLSVVGMHYIGNFGISNYTPQYQPRFLAASIVIAIGDCLLVLILFYTLREQWISSWWKRLMCASLLAGGVSAMHFTASTHCSYLYKGTQNQPTAISSRNVQVAVAGGLSVAAALTVVGVLLFSRHRARVLKTRSQKVMLACAMFDPDGRILVTTEGVLPAREITDKYQHRTFNDDFDTAHPVFQWIYRVTRSWPAVSDLVPQMKGHLAAYRADSEDESKPLSSTSSANFDPDTYSDYSIIFRERFCCAAASLAAAMNMPTERIGVLYDKIIETGTLHREDRFGKRAPLEAVDVESGRSVKLFGRGQLLFLARQLNTEDADKLLNAGFRFGGAQQVGRNISQMMQIPQSALEYHLAGLRHYVDKIETLEKPGTWLSFFGLIPRPNTKGFDVGVKKDDQDQLPDVQILPSEPQQWQAEFLQKMDGLRTRPFMAFLEDRSNVAPERGPREQQFASVLLQALVKLAQNVPADWFREARFVAKPVYGHYSQNNRHRTAATWIYAFCMITDMHTSLEACNGITRVPLTFFSARQRCYSGSPDHNILAQEIHQEFGPLLARRLPGRSDGLRRHRLSLHRRETHSKTTITAATHEEASRNSSLDPSEDSSVHELVEHPSTKRQSSMRVEHQQPLEVDQSSNNWGGILVNSETVVKSDSRSDFSHESKNLGLGMRVAVGTVRQEDTFVDELMEVTRVRFMAPRVGL
ncbi:hypothetical protein LTR62_007370 [Meristemomyces frigidus]|uniref:MHYT domain-containing protein n=1 Tax=Meristemomyces frigidus TaxID=1508187 RepID=A0AAN7TNG0_9PEZI|nr:hypothetical protein LTR62_007370 [Meristemomyces frigidus]